MFLKALTKALILIRREAPGRRTQSKRPAAIEGEMPMLEIRRNTP
jgi:hypothetical protein